MKRTKEKIIDNMERGRGKKKKRGGTEAEERSMRYEGRGKGVQVINIERDKADERAENNRL